MKQIISFILLILSFHTIAQNNEKETTLKGNTLWLKGIQAISVDHQLNAYQAIIIQKNHNLYQNILRRSNTLFIVFTKEKSQKNPTSIMRLFKKDEEYNVKTDAVLQSNTEIAYNDENLSASIIDIRFTNRHLKHGNIEFNTDFFNSKNNNIYEVIYFPNRISNKQKRKIETYLSLKYGISLEQTQNYYNSSDDIIWEAKEQKGYNNHVIGIGFDHLLGLSQVKSINSENDFISISYSKNTKPQNKSFFIIGQNEKKQEYKQVDGTNLQLMQTIWTVKQTRFSSNYKYNISIKQLESNNSQFAYWMIINDQQEMNLNKVRWIEAKEITKKRILFENINIDTNEKYFTFVKTPKNYQPNKELLVYPNPVKKETPVTISVYTPEKKEITFTISNLKGQIIYSGHKTIKGVYKFMYYLPNTGIYMLTTTIGSQVTTTKIISE